MIPFLHESPRCPSPLSPGWQSHRIANKRRASARHSSLALDATASDVPPLPPLLCPPTSLYTPFDCSHPLPLHATLPIAAFLGPRCTRSSIFSFQPSPLFAPFPPTPRPHLFLAFSFLRQTVSSFRFLSLCPSASIRPPTLLPPPFYPILSVYPLFPPPSPPSAERPTLPISLPAFSCYPSSFSSYHLLLPLPPKPSLL